MYIFNKKHTCDSHVSSANSSFRITVVSLWGSADRFSATRLAHSMYMRYFWWATLLNNSTLVEHFRHMRKSWNKFKIVAIIYLQLHKSLSILYILIYTLFPCNTRFKNIILKRKKFDISRILCHISSINQINILL